MTDRVSAFRTALVAIIARTLAFAAAFGGLGIGLNAYAAFGPHVPDPRFSDELIFGSNNAVVLLILRIVVPAFLLGSTIAFAVAARRSLLRGCMIAGALGTAFFLVGPLLLGACSAEFFRVSLAVLGVVCGVVSVWSPKPESHRADAA